MGALRLGLLAVGAAASAAGVSSAGTPAAQALSALHVPRALAVRQDVRISFRASQLPEGGYYYAVIVLKPYKRYTRASPPPCSASSDMRRADYGYPQRDGVVKLALAPASSRTGRWCRGGTYAGAIYAVPHAPPCESRYPCGSEPYEPPSPCWRIDGHLACGVVARSTGWSYPQGLPKPLARGTTIVARFTVRFFRES